MRFTERHPDIVALKQQINDLETKAAKENPGGGNTVNRKSEIANPVYEQVKVRLVEAETTVVSAERRLKQAQDEQAVLEERARATPELQAKFEDVDRDYSIKKKNFEELTQRREQTRIGESADARADKVEFRVIDPPQVPASPTAPNRPLLLSGVLVAALGAAVAVPLLLMQFDKSFASLLSVRALGFPVVGSVSWMPLPGVRRRLRFQLAVLCVSGSALLMIYVVLLAYASSFPKLGLV
jgi:polysaccharide chain length determinant protein (PEP-CTERM system associated)